MIYRKPGFLPLYELTPCPCNPSPHLPLACCLFFLVFRTNVLTGEGERGSEEPNHTTARKPGPLLIIQYSLLSAPDQYHSYPLTDISSEKTYSPLLIQCNYSEMEFLNSLFSQGFLGINLSLLRLEFLSSFLPSFFYKMLFMNRLEFSCFADFLSLFLKPEQSIIFF